MVKEIIPENLKTLEIKQIALNKDKFGALTFDKAYPLLHKLRKIFVEFEELGYEELLTQDEINDVNNKREQLLAYIKRIHDIHPETDASFNKDVRDQIENEIEGFYNGTVRHLRNNLIYLRQEAVLKSKDEKSLQEERKTVLQVRKQSEEILDQLKKELRAVREEKRVVRKEKKEVEEAHGEIAAKVLAYHFAKQANDYTKEAKGEEIDDSKIKGRYKYWKRLWKKIKRNGGWLKKRSLFYWALIIIISLNFITYFTIFILNKLEKIPLETGDIFTIEYGIMKIALITLLSWGLGFASKNYNIYSNLEAVARHRKNVAQTLDDFLATNPDEKARSQMIKQGTEAMFKHLPTGYIPKSEQKSEGPIYEIINNILRSNKQ